MAAGLALALAGSVIGTWWWRRSRSCSRLGGTPTANSHNAGRPVGTSTLFTRNLDLARLGLGVGSRWAAHRARRAFASNERKIELDHAHELHTAEQVAERLGSMKGAFMKIGQMASYLDEGLPEPLRRSLATLQADAPPMAPELAAGVLRDELGKPPEEVFVRWDPVPMAAASIGQVHRAIWRDPHTGHNKAVAVKVQYPGVDKAIAADLKNTNFVGAMFAQMFKGLDPGPMVEEIKARVSEELDYRLEARNQMFFWRAYEGHPTIHIPRVIETLSTRRVLVTELAEGVTFEEMTEWDQHERDLAAETIYRFVFRSLWRLHAFNGDPHPGNYRFTKGGQVTFLDFGMVKYFNEDEIDTFSNLIRHAVLEPDDQAFVKVIVDADLLHPGETLTVDEAASYFSHFYLSAKYDAVMEWTPEYASATTRMIFAPDNKVTQHITLPSSFVVIQRINLGLYAILGTLRAHGNYRRISEELWPFVDGPPSTAIGKAEDAWLAKRRKTGSEPGPRRSDS